MNRGTFLSLDGLDGAGKSTQCRMLVDWLRQRGRSVLACADPGGTHVGDVLRGLLLDPTHPMALPCEALLFMASRAQLVAEVIRPALAAGHDVVCDRFLLANVVYQGHAAGLAPQALWNAGLLGTDGLLPDLTIVLDVPVSKAAERRKPQADRLESRDADYHERVRQGFLTEAARQPQRIVVVDATRGPEAVHDDIRRRCEPILTAT